MSLIGLEETGLINHQTAKEVFSVLFDENTDPENYVKEHGLRMENDQSLLDEAVCRVLAGQPKAVGELKEGKDKVMSFLLGQVMKEMKGKANPSQTEEAIKRRLPEY